jgi:bifunctional oligoribonuclease and PAP phosphatase NrnA
VSDGPAAVLAALSAAPSIAVLAHVNPEGDAIGATLGATLALRAAGKTAAPFNADPIPSELSHLPGVGELSRVRPAGYACYLVVDTSDLERTGGLLAGREAGTVVVNVDHHAGNTRFGDVNWVEPAASSAGELVHRLLREGGLPVPAAAAANLFAAILTDTGAFQFANTCASALRAAADLVEAGADPEAIGRGLRNRPLGHVRLLGEALRSLQVTAAGRVAWIEVTVAMRREAGVGLEATEGFIEYPRNLAGVQLAAAFKEIGPGEVRVSLRSFGSLDVAGLAGRFGGGGHRNAAGCTVWAGLAEAKARMLPLLEALVS